MAEYVFTRGKFGMWGMSMWAGETQAFKFIRLLRKQGYTGIKYEEGPMIPYSEYDMVKTRKYFDCYKYINYRDLVEVLRTAMKGEAPKYFKVSFKEVL